MDTTRDYNWIAKDLEMIFGHSELNPFEKAAITRILLPIRAKKFREMMESERPMGAIETSPDEFEVILLENDLYRGTFDLSSRRTVLESIKSVLSMNIDKYKIAPIRRRLESAAAAAPSNLKRAQDEKHLADLQYLLLQFQKAWDIRIELDHVEELGDILGNIKAVEGEDTKRIRGWMVSQIANHIKPAYELELVQIWTQVAYNFPSARTESGAMSSQLLNACTILMNKQRSSEILAKAYTKYCEVLALEVLDIDKMMFPTT